MNWEKENAGRQVQQSGGLSGGKLAAVLFGVIDILLAVILVFSVLYSPISKSVLAAEVPGDFDDNSETYGAVDTLQEYTCDETVSYTSAGQTGTVEETTAAGQTGTAQETDAESSDSIYAGFIFPDSDKVLLTDAEIRTKVTTAALCRRAINEIYARHGYDFTTTENQEFFGSYDWYRNMTKESDQEKIAAQFSSIEKANVDKLALYEESMGWK